MTSAGNSYRTGTRLAVAVGLALAGSALSGPLWAAESIIMQSTTSTAHSGLLDYVLPVFEAKRGIRVNVVAVGTGQAIRNARNCDGDVLLVHARADEEAFVAAGYGVKRHDLMVNDFVIVGPAADPAGIAGGNDAMAALSVIAATRAVFASRGDDSGTHRAEQRLWKAAGIDPASGSGTWYRETGSGMGATLNTGVGMGAYVLTDRATWASFRNKGDFSILVQGDVALFNEYGVIAVNPAKCPNVKADSARQLVDWLLSDEGQQTIADFRVDGEPVFFPNAKGVKGAARS